MCRTTGKPGVVLERLLNLAYIASHILDYSFLSLLVCSSFSLSLASCLASPRKNLVTEKNGTHVVYLNFEKRFVLFPEREKSRRLTHFYRGFIEANEIMQIWLDCAICGKIKRCIKWTRISFQYQLIFSFCNRCFWITSDSFQSYIRETCVIYQQQSIVSEGYSIFELRKI